MCPAPESPGNGKANVRATWTVAALLVAAGVGGPVYTSSTIGDRVTRIEAKLDAMTEAVRELRGEVRVANDVPSEMSRTKALIREMVRPEALR